jgi:hypothetical protein
MNYKNRVRRVFNNYYDFRVRIVTKEVDQSIMNKSLFLNIIKNLKEIEDRRDFMNEEIGLDMTTYEDKFFAVIEDLFRMNFNSVFKLLLKFLQVVKLYIILALKLQNLR